MAKGDWAVRMMGMVTGEDGHVSRRQGWGGWVEGRERVDGVGVGSGACLVAPFFILQWDFSFSLA